MSVAIHHVCTPALLMAMLLLTACIGTSVPFGYAKIQDTEMFVPEELLDRIVKEKWERSTVVAEFGSPDAENGQSRTIGYERCIVSDSKAVPILVLPLPIPMSSGTITHCQLVKLWLDGDGKVIRWSDRAGVKEIPPEGRQVYNLGCTLEALLDGAYCVDNRGLFGKDWGDEP